jgi:hypothetical protein
VRIFIPKKLINTVACPSHAAVIRLSLHSAGFAVTTVYQYRHYEDGSNEAHQAPAVNVAAIRLVVVGIMKVLRSLWRAGTLRDVRPTETRCGHKLAGADRKINDSASPGWMKRQNLFTVGVEAWSLSALAGAPRAVSR